MQAADDQLRQLQEEMRELGCKNVEVWRKGIDTEVFNPKFNVSNEAMRVLGAVSHEEYQGIIEYAAYLGMHPVHDAHLLWIARDALHATVPAPWVEGLDMRGRLYYFNTTTEETLREHPLDEYYRQLYLHHMGKPSLLDDAGGLADGTSAIRALPEGVTAGSPIPAASPPVATTPMQPTRKTSVSTSKESRAPPSSTPCVPWSCTLSRSARSPTAPVALTPACRP